MSLGSRLKFLRTQSGLTQYELAQKINLSKANVSKYESNQIEPNLETLILLAKIFNVSVDSLIGKVSNDISHSGGIKIPVLGKVAAGIPIEAIEDILDYEEITSEMAACGEYFALRISGSSMEPKISDGDVVIVRKQETVDSGQIAIVLVNGDDATCKKFVRHDNGISLISLNPAFPPMFYTNEEIEKLPVRLIGRVVELRAKFL